MDFLAGLLPYALILLCPVLMLFMHGSHGHGRDDLDERHADHLGEPADRDGITR